VIGVSESAVPEPAQTDEELYALLIGYYGRVLRVRFSERDYELSRSIYGGAAARSAYRTFDRVGRLQGIALNSNLRGSPDASIEEANQQYSSVALSLQGFEAKVLDSIVAAEVQVLQEDTGKWFIVHRGAGFFDPIQTAKESS